MKGAPKLTQPHVPKTFHDSILPQDAISTDLSRALEWAFFRPKLPKPSRKTKKTQKPNGEIM